MADVTKVLAIDGGGVRGMIPAILLHEIEERTGARIASLFDMIAGTSAGGILALGLVKPAADDQSTPEHAAAELCELYEWQATRLFNGAQADAASLERALRRHFGDARLSH